MTPTTIQESQRLIELERVIKTGIDTFIQVGGALFEIKESRLYRIEHGTFEEYCKDKWNMSKAFAFRQIAAAKTTRNLSPIGDIKPQTESQARPLTKLPAEQQPEAWKEAVERAGGEQPTAKQVEAVVAEAIGNKTPRSEPPDYTPALGLQIADNAIRILSTITTKDSAREAGFEKVISYCRREIFPKTEKCQRGTFEHWKQFRDVCDQIQRSVDLLNTLNVDAPHEIQARDLCASLSKQLMEVSNKQ